MINENERSSTLNMAWDYFKLLAQQRVTHFNLFIVFMGAITAILTSNIHTSLKGDITACALSFIQIFLCFIFHKIDLRNKFLIKHTENIIKNIENTYEEENLKIFLLEEKNTDSLRDTEKHKLYFKRQLSTSQLYNLFYFSFFLAGLVELSLSIAFIIF